MSGRKGDAPVYLMIAEEDLEWQYVIVPKGTAFARIHIWPEEVANYDPGVPAKLIPDNGTPIMEFDLDYSRLTPAQTAKRRPVTAIELQNLLKGIPIFDVNR